MNKEQLLELLKSEDFNEGIRNENSPYKKDRWEYKERLDIVIDKRDEEYFFEIKSKEYSMFLHEKELQKHDIKICICPGNTKDTTKREIYKRINSYLDSIVMFFEDKKSYFDSLKADIPIDDTENDTDDILLELEELRAEIKKLRNGNKGGGSSTKSGFQKYLDAWDNH